MQMATVQVKVEKNIKQIGKTIYIFLKSLRIISIPLHLWYLPQYPSNLYDSNTVPMPSMISQGCELKVG